MKYALIIGNSEYDDPKLAQLKTPDDDARALAKILGAESIGAFDEVTTLINETESKATRVISDFLSNKKPDDLVLLYFSGHGVLDSRGNLFLAVQDTATSSLNATAISTSAFLSYEMENCRSKSLILILDCCHSGAFARGTKGEQKAITETTFESSGFGRAVLTASDSMQIAFEGDQVIGKTNLSLFTHFLLEGLETGEADRNRDGQISLDEWYQYAFMRISERTPQQTPRKWAYNQQGELFIAKNRFFKEKTAVAAADSAQPAKDSKEGTIEMAVREFEALLRSRATEAGVGEKVRILQEEYKVRLVDWTLEGNQFVGLEQVIRMITLAEKTWSTSGVESLYNTVRLMADIMGGKDRFVQSLGGVTINKSDIGAHFGEALAHQVRLSMREALSPWLIVHEFAHAWDANYGWRLSSLLEKYTGGYTNPFLSLMKRLAGLSDSGLFRAENKPGHYGRKPGCNKAGYFYGDQPSGSNWSFDRREDFAESVTMYMGWERGNDLSQHARKRIVRYKLTNGERDAFGVVENWADYAKHFYPENGDYTKTKRWQFVDDLVKGRLAIV